MSDRWKRGLTPDLIAEFEADLWTNKSEKKRGGYKRTYPKSPDSTEAVVESAVFHGIRLGPFKHEYDEKFGK